MNQVPLGTVLIDIIASVLLGFGALALLSPVALYWFIHGDTERYQWIIQGPYPFSHFGGGPFQMAMGVSLLLLATLLLTSGGVLKRMVWKKLDLELEF